MDQSFAPMTVEQVIVRFGYHWKLTDGSEKNFTDARDEFEIDRRAGKIINRTITLGDVALVSN